MKFFPQTIAMIVVLSFEGESGVRWAAFERRHLHLSFLSWERCVGEIGWEKAISACICSCWESYHINTARLCCPQMTSLWKRRNRFLKGKGARRKRNHRSSFCSLSFTDDSGRQDQGSFILTTGRTLVEQWWCWLCAGWVFTLSLCTLVSERGSRLDPRQCSSVRLSARCMGFPFSPCV